MDCMQNVPRLVNGFIPSNYKLKLSIERRKRKFSGTVIISGITTKKSKKIIFHSKALDIQNILLDDIKNVKFSYGKNDSLIIEHPDISKGKHLVVINFNGNISDSMHGMYPCYFNHDGKKKELLATQFESHHAREVFPCIDEPEAKATFDVTLVTEPNLIVLGNMPIKNKNKHAECQQTIFETTPIMSTYLLAWVIGEMHKKSAKTKSGIEVSVWATPAQPDTSLDFPLDIAVRSIDYFEEYFGVDYPLAKCDNVALPDFSAGAMENWGLVTYREVALLVDPKTTSISSKQYAATVIAHELSHQWFGNLVTMKWWNDLWLNESFATFIEYLAIDSLEPSWNIWSDFASFETSAALRRDSIAGVQPVQTDVSHPDEIGALFDGAIVYAKGARLIKMLRHYIGDDVFRLGLKEYFKKYAYKNTEAKDLWQILSKASNKDISGFMTRWINQPGFPVLCVSRDDNAIQLEQKRLSNISTNKSESIWPITLNSNYPEIPEIFDTKKLTVRVSGNKPILFNIGNEAHFITQYDHILLFNLINEIKLGKMAQLTRLQLLNEQNILANVGSISNAELIPLVLAFEDENSESIWNIIGMTIGELKKFVENDDISEPRLLYLAEKLAISQFHKLGWEKEQDESESKTKLRNIIISLMLYSENKNVVLKAKQIFQSSSVESINPEYRGMIISSVIRQNNEIKLIKSLFLKYKNTTSAEIQQEINIGITSTKDPTAIELILENIKNPSIIRPQDATRWYAYLIRNKYAKEKAWFWLRNNWDWVQETFGNDKSYDDFPRYIAMALSTQKQLDEYIDFFGKLKSDPSLTRVIDMGINEIKNRVNILQRDSESVRDALINF